MKIYSVCKFVGIEEDDALLRIKIENEKDVVDQWILLMNKRRWNGDSIKDASFERIISQKFYKNYRNRIKCIKLEVTPWDGNFPIWSANLKDFCKTSERDSDYFYYKKLSITNDSKENRRHLERFMLSAARHHSSYAYDYLKLVANDRDIILISDLDESIDVSDRAKKVEITNFITMLSRFQAGGRILRHKFQYDYMNSWPKESFMPNQEKGTRWIHAICWKTINEYGRYAFQDLRAYDFGNNLVNMDISLAFEYTLCCNMTELINKFKYNGHANGVSQLDILTALKLNKLCIDTSNLNRSSALKKINESTNLHLMDDLDEKRSSEYVLNNIETLRTNNVSSSYKLYRKRFAELIAEKP